MAYGKTLAEIMAEPSRPSRRPIRKALTLADIMRDKPADRDDGDVDGEIPTTEGPLRAKLAAWDAEIGRIKNELFARKLAVKPVGERALAAAHERDLNQHLGRMMVVRDEIAGRLQRCLQARVVEEMHSDDPETRAELQKLYSIRSAIISKRTEPISDTVRAELAQAINVRENRLSAMR